MKILVTGGAGFIGCNFVYYMLNKPSGVVSATEDKNEKTVLDLLPEEMRRSGLFPAGRLDKDTTGLLIITDDGGFAHRMLSPKKHVWKYYLAELDRAPEDEKELKDKFSQGVTLSDGTVCAPGEILSVGIESVTLRIREGKYHQVKRMIGALGYTVTALERYRIGGLMLDSSLSSGQARELKDAEISAVFKE